MAARQARANLTSADRPSQRWHGGSQRTSRPPHRQAAVIASFQRSRLLVAALEQACEHGCGETSVAAIITRAGVSRKTFYEIFRSRDDCFTAVSEEAIAQMSGVVIPAYRSAGTWAERIRAALTALLGFLEGNRNMGRFALGHIVGKGPIASEFRAPLLGALAEVVEEGRSQATPRQELPPLTGEFVVGGVLAVAETQLTAQRSMSALVSPLMWMIVLPYLGPAAAAAELRRASPAPAVPAPAEPSKIERGPLDGLDMRVTYRTATTLAVIGEHPGASNVEIASLVWVTDQGQISKLLARLARLGLIKNTGAGQAKGAPNAWHLTRRGTKVNTAITREFAFAERGRVSR